MADTDLTATSLLPEVQFGEEPTDPTERAQHRLRRLATSFAEVLATVAQMLKDEDWKHVNREDGTPYASLADLLRDHLHVSVAMARRYVQGARDIYLPLQELVVEGTPIQIAASDVATLGQPGAAIIVDHVRDTLTGDETPEEAARVIEDGVERARAERAEQRAADEQARDYAAERAAEAVHEDATGAQREWDRDDTPTPPAASEATVMGTDAFAELDDPTPHYDDTPTPAPTVGALDDEYAAVMAGATPYDTPESIATLTNPDLAALADALRVVAAADMAEVADMVTYETRGVVASCDEVVAQVYKLRSAVETSPWFMEHIG